MRCSASWNHRGAKAVSVRPTRYFCATPAGTRSVRRAWRRVRIVRRHSAGYASGGADAGRPARDPCESQNGETAWRFAVVEALDPEGGDQIEIRIAGKRGFEMARDRSVEEAMERIRRLRRPLPPGFKWRSPAHCLPAV